MARPSTTWACPFTGASSTGRKGYMANNLTASVGDGNSLTPESKTFLVKVEKV